MRVRYVAGPSVGPADQRLTLGQDYLVLGLSFEFGTAFTAECRLHLLLEHGGIASSDLAQFEITDPRTSRFWRIRMGQFDGRQFVDLLPPELVTVIHVDDRDERTSEEQDIAVLEALRSAEFRRICTVLENECRSSDGDKTEEAQVVD
jgi:hypothetical protein